LPRRYTYEEVKKEFEDNGYVLLSDTYINGVQKLDYICPAGHKGSITFSRFRIGQRCKLCFWERRREKLEDIRRYVESQGYKLLSNNYKNAWGKVDLMCPNGHMFSVKWSHFKNDGTRCVRCLHDSMKKDNQHIQRMRERADYINWRKAVWERDNYTCQVCGRRGNKLNAHHLYSYADYPDKRLDLENGVTLCFECHSHKSPVGFHRIYGLLHNTREQFEEYREWRRQQLGLSINTA
jgi:5-methylcytosine-specific restriction endonuclease McrA